MAAAAFSDTPGAALADSSGDRLWVQEDRPPGRVKIIARDSAGRLEGREITGGLLLGATLDSVWEDEAAGRVLFAAGEQIVSLPSAPPSQASRSSRAAIQAARGPDGAAFWQEGDTRKAATLPADQRNVRLEFAANDYEVSVAGRSGLAFRSRLEGFDAGWSSWSAEAQRDYTNLPPGSYSFAIEARTLAGAVLAAPPLVVFAPALWWETGWAKLGAGLGGAALLAVAVRWWSQRRLRARLRRLTVEAALQQERLRIARDMHDGVGSGLGRLHLSLEQIRHAGTAPAAGDDSPLAEAARSTRDLADQARDIIWAVTPAHDTLDALLERLAETVQRTAAAAGLGCRLDLPEDIPDRPVRAEVRHHLLLAVKEALHNAVRHAGATQLRFHAAVAGEQLTIGLGDDGRGFDPAAGGRPGGLGLESLRARAALLRGKARITSQPGGGTSVELVLPLSAAGITDPPMP